MGAALTLTFYTLVGQPWFQETPLNAYTTGHWVEYAAVGLFCWGFADLCLKRLDLLREWTSLRYEWLPASFLGGPQPVTAAVELFGGVQKPNHPLAGTYMQQRLRAALLYVRERRSSDGLDQHLQYLAQVAAQRAGERLASVRVLAWSVLILGFLGATVGAAEAVEQFTPERSWGTAVADLGSAFDAAALSLMLSLGLVLL
ncbi:MAG: hypothetical protein ACRDD1_16655, partial [Planctomycetia bacterium]